VLPPAVPAAKPPSGFNWSHEIKHDGFRLMSRRDLAGVRLLTRNAHAIKRLEAAAGERGNRKRRGGPLPLSLDFGDPKHGLFGVLSELI
jgi:hypothetical protein